MHLPMDKILHLSQFKSFSDDFISVAQMVAFFFDRIENIVRKVENACHQHFLLFSRFQKAYFEGSLQVGIVQ